MRRAPTTLAAAVIAAGIGLGVSAGGGASATRADPRGHPEQTRGQPAQPSLSGRRFTGASEDAWLGRQLQLESRLLRLPAQASRSRPGAPRVWPLGGPPPHPRWQACFVITSCSQHPHVLFVAGGDGALRGSRAPAAPTAIVPQAGLINP